MSVLRVISAAILSGFVADDLGATRYTAVGMAVLIGLLFITILEAGSWRNGS